MKRGLLLLLLLIPLVYAQSSDCTSTNIPSYTQYADPQVKIKWDEYSSQSKGVCRIDKRLPSSTECKFAVQLSTGGQPPAHLCWFGEAAGPKQVRPSACEPTHLPSYKQYVDSKVKSAWDSYSAQTIGVCAYHPPARPESGKCVFTVEIQEGNQPMWLCWYGKNPIPQVVEPEKKPGFFSRLWTRVFGRSSFPFSERDAVQMFSGELAGDGELPRDSVKLIDPSVVPKGTKIQDGPFSSMVLLEDARFAWVDPLPSLMYAHPTIYLLLFADGSVESYRGNAFPLVGGKDLREYGSPWDVTPTGRFVAGAVTGMDVVDKSDPYALRADYKWKTEMYPAYAYAYADAGKAEQSKSAALVCPPGYEAKETVVEERGVSFTIVDANDRNIDFVGDANRFTAATKAAGFEDWGMATSIDDAKAKLTQAKSLEEPSSLAIFISTHGSRTWNIKLKSPNGQERLIQNYPDMDPGTASLGLPQGWTIESKTESGWCLGLGGQCVGFNPDALGAVKSCRKFLASSACYAGKLTEHSVQGLAAYAGSQSDRPGLVLHGKSLFGESFTNALVGNPPLNPLLPDEDEPKPEFDSAFAGAKSSIGKNSLQGETLRIPLGGGKVFVWKFDQSPVEKFVEGKTNCNKKIECVPRTGVQPPKEEPRVDPREEEPSGCSGLLASVALIPEGFALVERGEVDLLQLLFGSIQDLEALKACYKCPPGQAMKWDCKPDGFALIDEMIAQLRGYSTGLSMGKKMSPPNLANLISALQKCKHSCATPTGSELPKTQVRVPGGDQVAVRATCEEFDMFTSERDCKKSCPGVDCMRMAPTTINPRLAKERPGADTLRCFMCDERESILDSIEDTGYIPSYGSTQPTTTPQVTSPVQPSCACPQGTSTQPPSSQSILQYLNQFTCVSGASINVKGTKTGSCPVCYAQPQITINQQKPVCQTPCGPVECGGGTSCPCPDKPNCVLTASCGWGGWKEVGEFKYQPVMAVSQ